MICSGADAAQLRRIRSERVEGYPDTGIDHPADVIPVFIDHADCVCCPHIKDQERHRIFCNPGYRVHHEVAAELRRVINTDIKPGLDACPHYKRLFFQDLLYCDFYYSCDLRHHR